MYEAETAMNQLFKDLKLNLLAETPQSPVDVLLNWLGGVQGYLQREIDRDNEASLSSVHGFLHVKFNKIIKVSQRDLADFCKSEGLDITQAIKLSNGEIKEYKGYKRPEILGIMGTAYREPWKATPEIENNKRVMENEQKRLEAAVKRIPKSVEVQLPTQINYTPKGK